VHLDPLQNPLYGGRAPLTHEQPPLSVCLYALCLVSLVVPEPGVRP
jgi:hypothetical protein